MHLLRKIECIVIIYMSRNTPLNVQRVVAELENQAPNGDSQWQDRQRPAATSALAEEAYATPENLSSSIHHLETTLAGACAAPCHVQCTLC